MSASETTIIRGYKLLGSLKKLDYDAIVANDTEAVLALSHLLEGFDDVQNVEAGTDSDAEKSEQERLHQIALALKAEGLDSRVGKVYTSFAQSRVLNFNGVPHRRGLPVFDLVLAADYSPIKGLHGIFICTDEVKSIVLDKETDGAGEWQELNRKPYSNQEELIQSIISLATGFDLN